MNPRDPRDPRDQKIVNARASLFIQLKRILPIYVYSGLVNVCADLSNLGAQDMSGAQIYLSSPTNYARQVIRISFFNYLVLYTPSN